MVLQELFKGTNRVRVQFAWRQDASGRLVAVPYVVGRARNRTVPTARRTGPTGIGAILIERQRLERALFRPHIIVGLGACLATMAGAYSFPDVAGERDPLRVASYVVSGIGFLGAGAIIVRRDAVQP
jgi:hypothetical protein